MFLKYFDQGYYTLPIKNASKATALPAGYSLYEWAMNGIDESLLDEWGKRYPIENGFGIALLCGKASRVIAVDIDTDDPRVLDIIPDSPCEKVGARPTRFFRYTEAYAQKINIGKNHTGLKDHVEILTSGQYCILPPSIHPDTKKSYFWTTEETLLWLSPDDLPELPTGTIELLQDYYAKKYKEAGSDGPTPRISLMGKFVSESYERCPHGSHDRLKQLAATMIRQEKPIAEAIRSLYDYDFEHHKPIGYFWDKSRGADSKLDPETNAARFYVNQLQFINRKRIMGGENPHSVIGEDIVIDIAPGQTMKIDLHKLMPYPRARGFMAVVQEHVQMLSPFRQDAISLGGALSLMSILAANRYRTQIGQYDIRPNLYVLNLAKSGAGKERTQSFLIDLLCNTTLLGSGGYKSGTAIVQGLPEQQERLNIIDEAASWLKSIGSGEGFQQEMNDVLSGLFTRVSGFYPGMTFATNKADRLGACWNPSLSILASTTLHGFKGAVNQDMGAKGLMPRFLTFWQHDLGEYRRPSRAAIQKAGEIEKKITAFVAAQLKIEKRLHPDFDMNKSIDMDLESGTVQSLGKRYDPFLIPISDAAEDRYFEYAISKAPKNTVVDGYDEAFLNRHAELAGKLALLDTISIGEDEISLESLEWAIAVVEAEWNNVRNLFEETSAENHTERKTLAILNVIRRNGGEISRSELTTQTRGMTPQERRAVLENLVESEQIVVAPRHVDGSKRSTVFIKMIKD